MAVIDNTTTSENLVKALDVEMQRNFNQEYDRLAEILGIVSPEIVAAGTAMYQYKVTGNLVDTKVDPSYTAATTGDDAKPAVIELGSSSGSMYVEGDIVALSKYELEKVPIGEVPLKPYRKLTTAKAILKSGYENAIIRTDRRMLQQVRAGIISDFFAFLANGTGTATGTSLQAALAYADAKLGDTLEANGDAADGFVHFVNRQDVAGHLANADITVQTVFGMDYVQDFLGVKNLFITNKVTKGTLYATPADNLHMYGIDFSTLADAGISYTTSAGGLIGVAHEPAMDRVSTQTHVLTGALLLAEIKDYIVKATISA